MRVMLAHNFYRSSAPSGEDFVYSTERTLLERYGNEVLTYERHNDDIDESTWTSKIQIALSSAWSRETYNELSALLRKTRPDVVHFHNTFPLISPSAYAACQDHDIPVVQTLHNYRLICPGALLMRDGKPCEDCVGGNLLPALQHRCYRSSLLATGSNVWMLTRNRWRNVYNTLVDKYIALSNFAANRLIAGGLSAERITVKPNFLYKDTPLGHGGGGYAVFVGRIDAGKGVRTLVQAWKHVKGLRLRVLGDGPLRGELLELVEREDLPIDFMGFLDRKQVLDIIGGAQMQIVPSEWYEGFPLVVLEAFALGTPVVASRIGSLDEIVVEGEVGAKFEAGDAIDLASSINRLLLDSDRLAEMRHAARVLFEQKYTEDKNYKILMGIYESLVNGSGVHVA